MGLGSFFLPDLKDVSPQIRPRECQAMLFEKLEKASCGCLKDPAVLKILRVVNSLRGVNLLPHCDFLSRRALCGHPFLGIADIFPLKEGSAA